MERYEVDEERAFQIIRQHARGTASTLVETAQSIVDGTLKDSLNV
jgi:AmiR/NasT family two-component response regulator